MPRERSNLPATQAAQHSALMANLPDDVRQDLLRAQKGMIGESQRLPQVKIMGAGAGLYEFTDTNETEREFAGVILGSHARNVLWDKAYGTNQSDEEKGKPACQSRDGITGIPREGFPHAALQRRGQPQVLATGTERIDCRSCPYNQWGSKHLIPEIMRPGDSGKGKATTNQRAVYVLVDGRETPVMLILPPTSISAFDEYLSTLLNRGIPVQATLTVFKQEKKERGTMKWAQATFAQGEPLSQEAFSRVLAKRTEYATHISGRVEELVVEDADVDDTAANNDHATRAANADAEEFPGALEDEDDDLPF